MTQIDANDVRTSSIKHLCINRIQANDANYVFIGGIYRRKNTPYALFASFGNLPKQHIDVQKKKHHLQMTATRHLYVICLKMIATPNEAL